MDYSVSLPPATQGELEFITGDITSSSSFPSTSLSIFLHWKACQVFPQPTQRPLSQH